MPRPSAALTLAAFLTLPLPALAQTLLSGDHSVDGNLCVGAACTNAETFSDAQLKLKGGIPRLLFEDNSSSGGVPTNDWVIETNADSATEYFAIVDDETDRSVLRIDAGGPENALYIADNGNVGLGTSIPLAPLHVETTDDTGIRINRSNLFAGEQAWQTYVGRSRAYIIQNITGNRFPFLIDDEAQEGALVFSESETTFNISNRDIDFQVNTLAGGLTPRPLIFGDAGSNRVGIGTNAPAAALHVQRADNTSPGADPAGILVEDASTLKATRGLLTLRNNGRAFFALEDTSIADTPGSGRQWNFQNRDGEFAVTTSPGGTSNIEMRLDSAGNMRIKGNFFAQNVGNDGTQIAVPDYVFAPDYDLKPLSEVAAFIAEHSHLPEVPSAAEITETGLNMTEMQMTLLKKIEELTLYTLEQQKLIDMQAAKLANMAVLQVRVDALEAAR